MGSKPYMKGLFLDFSTLVGALEFISYALHRAVKREASGYVDSAETWAKSIFMLAYFLEFSFLQSF